MNLSALLHHPEQLTPVVKWVDLDVNQREHIMLEEIEELLDDIEGEGEASLRDFQWSYVIEYKGLIASVIASALPGGQIFGIPALLLFGVALTQTMYSNSAKGCGALFPGITVDALSKLSAAGRAAGVSGKTAVGFYNYIDDDDKAAYQALSLCKIPLAKRMAQEPTIDSARKLKEAFIDRFIAVLTRVDTKGILPITNKDYLYDQYKIDGGAKLLGEVLNDMGVLPPASSPSAPNQNPITGPISIDIEEGEVIKKGPVSIDIEEGEPTTTSVVDVEAVATYDEVEVEEVEEVEAAIAPTFSTTPNQGEPKTPVADKLVAYGKLILYSLTHKRWLLLDRNANPNAPLAFTVILGDPGSGKGFLAANMLEVARLEEDAEIWVIDCKSDAEEAGYFKNVTHHYLIDTSPVYDQLETIRSFLSIIQEFEQRIDDRKNGRESKERPLILYFADISPMATLLMRYTDEHNYYRLFMTTKITQARSQNAGVAMDCQSAVLKHMGVEFREIANLAEFRVCVQGESKNKVLNTLRKIEYDTKVLKSIPSQGRGWIILDQNGDTVYVPSLQLNQIPVCGWGANVIDCRVLKDRPSATIDIPIFTESKEESESVIQVSEPPVINRNEPKEEPPVVIPDDLWEFVVDNLDELVGEGVTVRQALRSGIWLKYSVSKPTTHELKQIFCDLVSLGDLIEVPKVSSSKQKYVIYEVAYV